MRKESKPMIETIINTSALALTSFGVMVITQNSDGWTQMLKGMTLICFGAGLEYFKYRGRKNKLW